MTMLLGTGLAVFIGLTVLLFGLAALLSGQALAETWRPRWLVLPVALVLAAADRFLAFALFGAPLLSVYGLVTSAVVLLVIADAAYRFSRARMMVGQYPWLYERQGLFRWREHS